MMIARTFLLFVAVASAAVAQTRLLPESDYEKTDEYYRILRGVFGRSYADDVTFSVLIVPSFEPEYATGVLKEGEGSKAFILTPSASVWQTEYDRLVAPDVTTLDSHGSELPRETPDPAERKKRGLPDSYRDIRTNLQTRNLPSAVADRLNRVWQKRVSQAIEPTPRPKNEADAERTVVLDGTSYYFATRVPEHGLVIAEGIPADKGTLVWRLSDLAEALCDYVKGKASLATLEKRLHAVE
jgi:hypothetical protein